MTAPKAQATLRAVLPAGGEELEPQRHVGVAEQIRIIDVTSSTWS
ncbi:hypothetical protein [Mycobacterium malmoense]|nr:hypothetical protein [Mycobacterium malmoense]